MVSMSYTKNECHDSPAHLCCPIKDIDRCQYASVTLHNDHISGLNIKGTDQTGRLRADMYTAVRMWHTETLLTWQRCSTGKSCTVALLHKDHEIPYLPIVGQNSVDPDQPLHYAEFDQALHHLRFIQELLDTSSGNNIDWSVFEQS